VATKNSQHTNTPSSYTFTAATQHTIVDTGQAKSARKPRFRRTKPKKSTYKYTYMIMPTKNIYTTSNILQTMTNSKLKQSCFHHSSFYSQLVHSM